jgi:hypothetical protein
MSISRILSECPNIQAPLSEAFIATGQREQLPFLEFLLSAQNRRPVTTYVSPGRGKLQRMEARWAQRLPESEVTAGADILTCSSENTYGDVVTTYDLTTEDTYQASQKISATDIARHCQDNSVYVLERVMYLMDVVERAVASAAASQAVLSIGSWGTEVSSFYDVTANCLEIATRQTGGQALNEFAMADVLQATRMANYPGAPIAFGGAEMQRYVNAVQAGCCTQYGLDLAAISAQNGFAFAYDYRIAQAFESQNNVLVSTPGAMQWLSYNLADWNSGFNFNTGNGYSRTIAFTPSGLPVDLTMKDDCGNLSIIVTATGLFAALPTDLYEASDRFAGINYVNCVSIVNP